MKLLSAAIPCYNSEAYMRHAIDTLLSGGESMEVIIVNDGSKDGTLKIAREYEERYPTIVKVVDQENGGHGAAVNAGLREATGLYFKVVDSDDWVDENALKRVLKRLKGMLEYKKTVDMFLCNYVYEHTEQGKQRVMDYKNVFPQNQIFSWNEIRHFNPSQYIIMHTVIYRTELLKDCGLELPKHTFYVDNVFIYTPLPYVKTMYYMNVDLYRYYIGREDQSVNEKVMIGRVDQQLFVTKTMIDSVCIGDVTNKKLQKYMVRYMSMMMTISTVFLLLGDSSDVDQKRAELWGYLEENDAILYRYILKTKLGISMRLQGRFGKKVIIKGYRLSQRLIGFNA